MDKDTESAHIPEMSHQSYDEDYKNYENVLFNEKRVP